MIACLDLEGVLVPEVWINVAERTGIEALVRKGIADRDRIGVMGWSNGGFLTNAMITAEPEIFKAASSGAGT